jgi:serine protease Do
MLFAAIALLSTPSIAQTIKAGTSQEDPAAKILNRLRPGIAKVRIISVSSGSETGSGTGFVVGDKSSMVTNYHVASDTVLHPSQYRLEYEANDGTHGNLTIAALDIANDLALLRLDKPLAGASPIEISGSTAKKGDTAFAIGFPLSKGLTIVSGTFNGKAEDYFQPLIHYSGALNLGMSGGPAVDGSGTLIGVNKAVTRDAQLVSLLIPSSKVSELLNRPISGAINSANYWKSEAERQLHQHADSVMSSLINQKLPTRTFDSYIGVDLEPLGFKCDGVHKNATGKYQHTLDGRICNTNSWVYVDNNIYMGSVTLYTGIRSNNGMNSLRFAEVRRTHFDFRKKVTDDPDKNKTGYECTERMINVNNLQSKTFTCMRKDHRFEDLYDTTFVMHSVASDRQSIQVRVEMIGVPFIASKAMIGRVIEGVTWNR